MGNVIFTDSQWQEFEKQKMFYKHFMSSAAVPPQLLVPLSCQSNSELLIFVLFLFLVSLAFVQK